MKACAKCSETKPLDDFHRQPSGPQGRHSYCKTCFNTQARGKHRNVPVARRRSQNLKTRYGITSEDFRALIDTQHGDCLLCEQPLAGKRKVVDHDHNTGKVRGILCHRCNVMIGGMDDHAWLRRALEYIGWRP